MPSAASARRPLPRWLAPEAADAFDAAVAAFPEAHLRAPIVGERFPSQEAAMRRLQDFAFAESTCAVKGRKSGRSTLHAVCLHQGTATRNTRKLTEEERKRPQTHVNQGGCT